MLQYCVFKLLVFLVAYILAFAPGGLRAQNRSPVVRPPSTLVVLIGGMDSDPTTAQLNRTCRRNEGNSGLYRLMGDLEHPQIDAKYFNWNGTAAGEIHTKTPPGTRAISHHIRDYVQSHSRCRVILVGNSWGGHTAWEVCDELFRSPEPIAIHQVVFLDPSSTGRTKGRPKSLPLNVNQSTNYYTRNLFGWRSWPQETRIENIDLGDRKYGFMRPGGPAYDSAFSFDAHVAAEWDEHIHADIREKILSQISRPWENK